MKILVLGGTGAMGTSLVSLLASAGNEVSVTTRSARAAAEVNIRYLRGNAREMPFLQELVKTRYDAIVDFMVYDTAAFRERRDLLLSATEQYLFVSSSRVYADSKTPITENQPRLLDVTEDEGYLQTDEYALTKARQENMLRESGKTNWTIIRPYITYSGERLQLGVFEKELWLYRALHGQTIVMPKDIASRRTTLTWGGDVAERIAALVGVSEAMGHTFHITTAESILWSEVLELYQRIFLEVTGKPMKVRLIGSSEQMSLAMGNQYQVRYDRLFDRTFDNSSIVRLSGDRFLPVREGLEKCLRSFLKNPKFRDIPVVQMAWMDRETGEKTKLSVFPAGRNRIKYILYRFTSDAFIQRLIAAYRIMRGEKYER